MSDYTPKSCELYDCLETIAALKKECHLNYIDDNGRLVGIRGQIVDVYARDNADWCKFSDNTEVRLDKIESFEQNLLN